LSAPFLLLLATGFLAIATLATRSKPRLQTVVGVGGCLALVILILLVRLDAAASFLGLSLKLGSVWRVLGRALVLDQAARAAIAFLYAVGGFLFFAANTAKVKATFVPLGLFCLACVAGSLMIRPFLYAAILLELAAIGGLLILLEPQPRSERGGLRLLSLYTMAMLAILLAGWVLDVSGLSKVTPELAQRATALLSLGFSILLFLPPFHIWLPAAAQRSHPYLVVFVAVVLQSAGLFFLLHFLDAYEWLRTSPTVFAGMRSVGFAVLVFGGLMAFVQTSFEKMMAYAMVADMGVTLIAVGAGLLEGYQLAMGLNAAKAVGLSTWALGASSLRKRQASGGMTGLDGNHARAPLAYACALFGAFSLAGLPGTAGFPPRWSLLTILASRDIVSAIGVIVATSLLAGSALRWLVPLVSFEPTPWLATLARSERILLLGGVLMSIAIGAFPQILYHWLVGAVSGLPNLSP